MPVSERAPPERRRLPLFDYTLLVAIVMIVGVKALAPLGQRIDRSLKSLALAVSAPMALASEGDEAPRDGPIGRAR